MGDGDLMQTPDTLNEMFEDLSDRLNLLSMDTTQAELRPLNQALSDWQDWYFGNYEQWPSEELGLWQTRFRDTLAGIEALEQRRGTMDEPIVTTPPSSGPIILPDEVIVGQRPWWYIPLIGAMVVLGGITVSKVLGRGR